MLSYFFLITSLFAFFWLLISHSENCVMTSQGSRFWEWSCNLACLASTLPLLKPPPPPSSKCVFFTDLFVTVTVLLVVAAQNQLIFHGFSWNYRGEGKFETNISLKWLMLVRRRLPQRERHKSNGFNNENNNLHVHHVFFFLGTFLYRHSTTSTWKYLISLCTEEVHKRLRNFLPLS